MRPCISIFGSAPPLVGLSENRSIAWSVARSVAVVSPSVISSVGDTFFYNNKNLCFSTIETQGTGQETAFNNFFKGPTDLGGMGCPYGNFFLALKKEKKTF